MESQPQNPEFRLDPENFHQCIVSKTVIERILTLFLVSNKFKVSCKVESDRNLPQFAFLNAV